MKPNKIQEYIDLAERVRYAPRASGESEVLRLCGAVVSLTDALKDALIPPEGRTMESAPKDEHGVIAFSPTFYQGKGGWVAAVWHKGAWHSNPGGWRFEPTHWMPMPRPPLPQEQSRSK